MESESKESDLLIEGLIMGLGRSLVLGKFPRIHKDDTSWLQAIVEKLPELAFSCNQIDDYLL